MNAALMNDTPGEGRRKTMWAGLGLLLGFTIAVVLVGRIRPMTTTVALGMSAVSALSTLAMAWLMARDSARPRWAWWATAGVMAAGILMSVWLVGDPIVWKKDISVGTWMFPWFLLVMGTTQRRRRAECAPAATAGWSMVGIGTVLTVLLLGAPLIVNRLF